MDFYNKEDFHWNDIQDLIENEVEENLHLDYKDERALDSQKIDEITRDVSAFANADGGIIIYGISEDNNSHKPLKPTPISNNKITKEWLEQKINLIEPRIKDVRIYPIDIEERDGYIFIVKIPRSDDAPHMAKDNRYYKRCNFSREPMQHYEVRDLFFRAISPKLRLIGCEFSSIESPESLSKEFLFKTFIQNDGKIVAQVYKVNAYFYSSVDPSLISIRDPKHEISSFTKMDNSCFRISNSSNENIFYNECVILGNYFLSVPEIYRTSFQQNLLIRIVLFYEKGKDEMLYIGAENGIIRDINQIEKILKGHFPDYHMDWL